MGLVDIVIFISYVLLIVFIGNHLNHIGSERAANKPTLNKNILLIAWHLTQIQKSLGKHLNTL